MFDMQNVNCSFELKAGDVSWNISHHLNTKIDYDGARCLDNTAWLLAILTPADRLQSLSEVLKTPTLTLVTNTTTAYPKTKYPVALNMQFYLFLKFI